MTKLLYLIAVLLAILIVWGLGLWAFKTADDVATAIGPVLTALATIGAAIFGISVGREAGKSEGHVAGVAAGKKEVAAEVMPHLENLASILPTSGTEAVLGPSTDVGRAPAGRAVVQSLQGRMQKILGTDGT